MQDKKVAPAKPERVTTPNSIGLRLGNLEKIRDAIETELESIFSGRKAVKQGLDDAVAKCNTLLKEFARDRQVTACSILLEGGPHRSTRRIPTRTSS